MALFENAHAGKVDLVMSNDNTNDMLEVRLVVDGIYQISELCIMLNNELTNIEYVGFIPNNAIGKTALAIPTRNSMRDIVFVAAFGGDALNGCTIELGTLIYRKANSVARVRPGIDAGTSGVYVIYGEGLDINHRVWIINSSAVSGDEKGVPQTDYLAANYPNPFNPGTYIDYGISENSWVKIDVYDIGGHIIKTLHNGRKEGGHFKVYWDGRNEEGRLMASGVYFCRMRTAGHEITRKLVLMR